ncbi:GPP34 family phosphoprotein [Solwaraspora sp. WMMD1047]|uniref:GOLPH3/VPS74 family protein n=1 Tax=Solwaraspora sp. WMMD1047 TaxID=3016102 RepID=UPI00241786EA|nr:GPP34 family phosphoprotein [Solwaraspora sp. WMMD1047]MDG4829996.1 GPP34 family phosphoprotein [Solwaraspora sp. WMMD1047]
MVSLALADQFYLIGHHETTGRGRLATRCLGLGLASALLGELLYAGNVWLQDGKLRLVGRTVPQDALAHAVFDQLAAQPGHSDVRTWVQFFSGSASGLVAERLWRAGYLRPESSRRFFGGKSVVYVPADSNRAAVPSALLSMKLRRRHPLYPDESFLVGLCMATGLDRILLDGVPAEVRRYADEAVASVWVPAYELVRATQAAVGDVVLTARG